jgi:hypothetical protein
MTIASAVPTTRAPTRSRLPLVGAGSTTPSVTASSPAATMASTQSRFRRLSHKEMADKRKQDKCYFCPEKFSQERKCAMKGGFLMELAEDDNPAYLADDLGISLHALTSLSSPNTLQLIITITPVLIPCSS